MQSSKVNITRLNNHKNALLFLKQDAVFVLLMFLKWGWLQDIGKASMTD